MVLADEELVNVLTFDADVLVLADEELVGPTEHVCDVFLQQSVVGGEDEERVRSICDDTEDSFNDAYTDARAGNTRREQ